MVPSHQQAQFSPQCVHFFINVFLSDKNVTQPPFAHMTQINQKVLQNIARHLCVKSSRCSHGPFPFVAGGILGLDNQDFIATAFDTFKNRQRETSSWSSSGSRRVRVRPRPPSTNTSGGRMSTSLSFGDLQRVMNGMKELQAAGKRRWPS